MKLLAVAVLTAATLIGLEALAAYLLARDALHSSGPLEPPQPADPALTWVTWP